MQTHSKLNFIFGMPKVRLDLQQFSLSSHPGMPAFAKNHRNPCILLSFSFVGGRFIIFLCQTIEIAS
ncbi:hypothetical protein C8N25_12344 [Algoriphagus antarcticus]|uniref:Uncharacterized protein n=1 Tax=Algoriphagus antarcticus TaxID=238540 RepID=A0A3E0DJU2_9BACT|nr:hypothetical protein C8N25_12344 [Algoriphagus antarcticus]